MARERTTYICQQCGASYHRWQGWCHACGASNTIQEEVRQKSEPGGLKAGAGRKIAFGSLQDDGFDAPRMKTGIVELDRVCGGGLVPASGILVGGDPGIGKSTLLLQAAAKLAAAGLDCVYISGEEATAQVGLRARRLGLADAPVRLAAANSLRDILTSLEADTPPAVVIIDSIQTLFADTLDSAPGTVSQVRTCAQELIRFAKRRGSCVLLVGHVTKDGQIAGPRVLEHMVDTVLYFEGERGHQFRILRAVKNRFGPTDEIGVFEMTDGGLNEVRNPSALFLGDRGKPISGTAVFAGIEGTRPLLVEIQALVGASPLGTPRRTVVGWDSGRLAMVLAVLDARCGLSMAGNDVYLNVAGGLRVAEPAADLAVAAALVSSLFARPVPANTVIFGEIGLSGEVRRVAQSDARIKEAAKLGFERAILPAGSKQAGSGLDLSEIDRLAELVELFEGADAAGHAAQAVSGRGA